MESTEFGRNVLIHRMEVMVEEEGKRKLREHQGLEPKVVPGSSSSTSFSFGEPQVYKGQSQTQNLLKPRMRP